MNRLSLIQEQITNNNFNNDIISPKNDDNIPYIIDGIRTPITKAFKGGLSKFGPEILLSELFTKIIERNSFLSENPKLIDEIITGYRWVC